MNKYEEALIEHNKKYNPNATSLVLEACKKAEAFDLLNKKEVDVFLLTHSLDCDYYNQESGFSKYSSCLLTQDEFNFLKKIIYE